MAAKEFNNIPKLIRALPSIFDDATEDAGVYYAGRVVARIIEQDPTWQPKSPATLMSEGEDKTKLWVNKGDLLNEIHQQRPDKTKKGEHAINVGVFSDDRLEAALALEYGTPNAKYPIVPRPLFAPVFDEQLDKILLKQKKFIERRISQFLR